MINLQNTTTEEAVATYHSTKDIFLGLLKEIRELSKKKPDAIMSTSKVGIINRVLTDLKVILNEEPEGKYLDILDNDNLPQMSDAVLIMVQYETALSSFKKRYYQSYGHGYAKEWTWITTEFVKEYLSEESEDNEFEDEETS